MLSRLLSITIALAIAVSATPARSDDDPAEGALRDFIEAINSGNDAGYRRFVRADFGSLSPEKEDEWVDWIAFLGERHESLQLGLIAERSPGSISAYVHGPSTDSWLRVTMEVEAEPPHLVSAIGVRKSMALSPVASPLLTPARVDAVLTAMAAEIRRDYVRRDFRESLVTSLLERAEAGGYRTLTNRFELARRLTEDLAEIADDKHLFLQAPDFAEAIRRRYYSDEGDHASAGHAPASDHGFTRAELLEEGVGLLEMSHFDGSAAAFATLERLLTPLADASALIIDLRYSGGGDGEMVVELISYLFAEPTEIGARMTQRTTPKPLSKAFADKPVYVLTGKSTASAAEALAFDLKQKGRARLVGAVTAGAGYMSDYRFLPDDFVLSLSIGQPYGSGSGWERVGVKPDVECAVEDALGVVLAELRDNL